MHTLYVNAFCATVKSWALKEYEPYIESVFMNLVLFTPQLQQLQKRLMQMNNVRAEEALTVTTLMGKLKLFGRQMFFFILRTGQRC